MKSIQSPYEVELLESKKDWMIFLGFMLVVFMISITLEYRNYRALLESKTITAQVLLQYKKEGKNYFVLKLKTARGETLYTTSRDDLRDLRGRFVSVYGKISADCDFGAYLKSCFFLGYSISLLHERDSKQKVMDYIASQHDSSAFWGFGDSRDSGDSRDLGESKDSRDSQDSGESNKSKDLKDSNPPPSPLRKGGGSSQGSGDSREFKISKDSRDSSKSKDSRESKDSRVKSGIITTNAPNDAFGENLLSQMYQALTLATPMPKELRDVANVFGIAHIFAISGFHLGVLSLVLYGVLSFPYRALQRRFFTYRNEFYDLNFIVLIFAFLYLHVLDFSPSFLRSFVMFAFGLFVLYKGLRLVSFKLLFACVVFILALFPRVFYAIGFWLSVAGIFYIYLFMRHVKMRSKWLYATLLNIAVTANMIPLSHFFFFVFSPLVAISPFITMAFVVFYPAVLVLHIFNLGYIFDSALFFIAKMDFFYVELKTSFAFLCGYLALSLVAIRKKRAYYALNAVSILFFAYGAMRFLKEY